MTCNIFNFFQAIDFWKLITVLVAIFATWISWSQHRINKEKFKLDLFEKRFAVFSATRKLLSIVLKDANLKLNELFEFRGDTAEAAFLFESDIQDYLSEIDKKALSLYSLSASLDGLPAGNKRNKKCDDISETISWLTDQLPELKTKFSPYLKFKTWK